MIASTAQSSQAPPAHQEAEAPGGQQGERELMVEELVDQKAEADETRQIVNPEGTAEAERQGVAAQNSSKEADEMGEGVRNFAGSGTVTI